MKTYLILLCITALAVLVCCQSSTAKDHEIAKRLKGDAERATRPKARDEGFANVVINLFTLIAFACWIYKMLKYAMPLIA